MRITPLVLFACILAAAPAASAAWMTQSFRTASGALVLPGDSMHEVLQEAGKPLDRRVISTGIAVGPLVGLTREQWTYRGSDGTYVLTFVGNRVRRIEVIPYR